MATDVAAPSTGERRTTKHAPRSRTRSTGSRIALLIGAFAFLFPFYYMIIGSLQKEPDSSPAGAFPDPSNLSLHNYAAIDSAISLGRSLVNSGIFTGGVIICTTVFGLLAGYALARLHFRGRGSTFALVLLVQVVPFQLLLIPLYVLIVRDYGLADSYLGMILPFAINTSAVFIFRQFFVQLPDAMFEAARIDGAGELQILFRIALPLCKPALMSVVLLSFTGPWNEFLWPFLVTKRQDMQPLAVSLANYISTVASAAANPFGAILAGACVLAAPAVALYLVFQSRFNSTDIDSATKG
ncbi:carbohydrate ABC transporter permease [Streptomyces sp. NRRL S-813]|uniref:carbohydrate ABC transporter permease n=1 Tax=Streptomyces sp. NRRL S-813 TaxID=1463919 RepID=UPI0004BF8057|nr:carbohydrate ABC transporter permease [Streptomyces sp. NRRL S-813]